MRRPWALRERNAMKPLNNVRTTSHGHNVTDKPHQYDKSAGPTLDVRRKPSIRTKTGCMTCRRRKKKCDETRPECEHTITHNIVVADSWQGITCLRLRHRCEYSFNIPAAKDSEAKAVKGTHFIRSTRKLGELEVPQQREPAGSVDWDYPNQVSQIDLDLVDLRDSVFDATIHKVASQSRSLRHEMDLLPSSQITPILSQSLSTPAKIPNPSTQSHQPDFLPIRPSKSCVREQQASEGAGHLALPHFSQSHRSGARSLSSMSQSQQPSWTRVAPSFISSNFCSPPYPPHHIDDDPRERSHNAIKHRRSALRTTVACSKCNSTNVRCDRMRPNCGQCTRDNFVCIYQGSSTHEAQDKTSERNAAPPIWFPSTSSGRIQTESDRTKCNLTCLSPSSRILAFAKLAAESTDSDDEEEDDDDSDCIDTAVPSSHAMYQRWMAIGREEFCICNQPATIQALSAAAKTSRTKPPQSDIPTRVNSPISRDAISMDLSEGVKIPFPIPEVNTIIPASQGMRVSALLRAVADSRQRHDQAHY